jgi:hypothetical protein
MHFFLRKKFKEVKANANLNIIDLRVTPLVRALAINSTSALNGKVMDPFEIYPPKQTGFRP